MNKIIVLLGITFVTLLTVSSVKSQKIDLFNGKDLKGWVIENDGQFSVEDGLLKVNKGTGWLRSDKKYSDFKMTMEFRFLEKDANSGI